MNNWYESPFLSGGNDASTAPTTNAITARHLSASLPFEYTDSREVRTNVSGAGKPSRRLQNASANAVDFGALGGSPQGIDEDGESCSHQQFDQKRATLNDFRYRR